MGSVPEQVELTWKSDEGGAVVIHLGCTRSIVEPGGGLAGVSYAELADRTPGRYPLDLFNAAEFTWD